METVFKVVTLKRLSRAQVYTKDKDRALGMSAFNTRGEEKRENL